jgi:small subunit ribosomal protein S9
VVNQHYYYGTGRRKTSRARVRLYPGAGSIVVNGKPMDEIFTRVDHQAEIMKPLSVTGQQGKFNAQIKVEGGGITGWAGAIRHGIARALVVADEGMKPALRKEGLLTRDPRVKERKKYGLKRARRAPQFTKR